jgi:hypothetical protein
MNREHDVSNVKLFVLDANYAAGDGRILDRVVVHLLAET